MWEERYPIEGETVKVNFAEFTNMGTQIGVFLRKSIDGYLIIDFGRCLRYLDRHSTIFVLNPSRISWR
jgi:hypothetical protein